MGGIPESIEFRQAAEGAVLVDSQDDGFPEGLVIEASYHLAGIRVFLLKQEGGEQAIDVGILRHLRKRLRILLFHLLQYEPGAFDAGNFCKEFFLHHSPILLICMFCMICAVCMICMIRNFFYYLYSIRMMMVSVLPASICAGPASNWLTDRLLGVLPRREAIFAWSRPANADCSTASFTGYQDSATG